MRCFVHSRAITVGLSAALFAAAYRADGQTFQPLGYLDLHVPTLRSYATAITPDGKTIVGGCTFYDGTGTQLTAVYWRQGKIVSLPPSTTGLPSTLALSVSADGRTIGGNTGFFISDYEFRNGLYWVLADGGRTKVRDVPESYTVNGVTADGKTRVGATRYVAPLPVIDQGFLQNNRTGFTHIGKLTENGYSWLEAVSADGSVAVGYACTPDAITAVRWTPETGIEQLAGIPQGSPAQACCVSADGSVIVGSLNSDAFRWTEAGGFEFLPPLPGDNLLIPRATASDGSVVAGFVYRDDGSQAAFIWDAENGTRLLQDALSDAGVDLHGWSLQVVNGMSGDGNSLVGWGINPQGTTEAFVVRLGTR